MTKDQEFSFEIRDHLKKLCDEERLTDLFYVRNVNNRLENNNVLQKLDVYQVLIDLITYCSMGDKEEAVKSLHLSNQFLDACVDFLWTLDSEWTKGIGTELLLEIWKLHFIDTKYHLGKFLNVIFYKLVLQDN